MGKGEVQKRGIRRRQLKPVVLIVTEGSQTEPKYFDSFRSRQTNIDIQVVSGGAGSGTDYASLVRKAVAYMEKNGLSPQNGDRLWIVADADVNYNVPDPVAVKSRQLETAKKNAAKHGIQIALSNPCFEIWFLLHFKYTSGHLQDYSAVLAQLRSYLPDYEKTVDVAAILAEHTEQAMHNAEKLAAYHTKNGHTDLRSIEVNPYTGVHELVDSIR